MRRTITFLEEKLKELQKMKEEMDRLWHSLIEENVGGKEVGTGQWVEKLPKLVGVGRKDSRSRSNKTIKY